MTILNAIQIAQKSSAPPNHIKVLLSTDDFPSLTEGVNHLTVHLFAKCLNSAPDKVKSVIIQGAAHTSYGFIRFEHEYEAFHYIHEFIQEFYLKDLSEYNSEVHQVVTSVQKAIIKSMLLTLPKGKKDPLEQNVIYNNWKLEIGTKPLLTPETAKLPKSQILKISYAISLEIEKRFRNFLYDHLKPYLPKNK